MKKIKMLLAALMLLASSAVFAQNLTVKGVVKDASTGEPVPFASVVIKGTTTGVDTDADGAFAISAPLNGTLVLSSIGYKTTNVVITGAAVLNVNLEPDAQFLDETIVVAYGTSTKAAFTGSASVLKSESIDKRAVSSVTQALAGAVAGVQATSSDGAPGSGATIRIRGFGSINAGMSPLYVVDGIPFDGDIASIATTDIESTTVLKDAAAAALYGARGANGVILIQTKQGRRGDAKVTFKGTIGANSRAVKNYDVLGSSDTYMETLYSALYNGAAYGLGYGPANADQYANANLFKKLGYQMYTLPEGQNLIVNGKINPDATLGYSDGKYFYTPDDWAANTFSKQLRQDYNLSVSGGTDKLNYYVSAGYLKDGGVITGSGFDRISTRAAVDYQAKKWLKIGTNISYSYTNSRYPDDQQTTTSSGNAFYIANCIAPVYPMFVRDASGAILMDGANRIFDYGDKKSTPNTRNWMSMSNPIGDLTYQLTEYLSDTFNGKWYLKVTPIDGLTLSATLGVLVDNMRSHMASSSKYGQSSNYGGEATQALDRTRGFTQQYIANYKKSFGLNNIDAMVGFEGYSLNQESMQAYGQNLYKAGDFTINNTIDQRRGYGSIGSYATAGIITRVNYNYDEKYFASVSYRRDASSKFAPEHRWGNFWSVAGAWNLSKESFIQNVEWIEFLKLKASFGQQGNDSGINSYAYLDQYTVSGADGVFSDGKLAYKGNYDLTWETTNSFNVGLDFSLFNSKFGGSIEYFLRQTKDMLYHKPVASSNGYSSVPMNIGSMRNSGVEIDLNANIIRNKNVSWDLYANATFLKNKIISLAPELKGELISGGRIYREGDSMYQLYMVKYAGVDPATGDALFWAKDKDGVEYATKNYTVAQTTNRQGTGDLLPKVSGGFGTTLTAFGFDLSVAFSYQIGGKIFDSGYQALMHQGDDSNIGQNWHVDIARAWTPANPYTDVPRLCNSDKYSSNTSTRFLTSSNYLSLNNVTLGYTLPQQLTKKISIDRIRFFATGDNLAVFSARKGLDPRQSFTSATTSLYTALRTIAGGIEITF